MKKWTAIRHDVLVDGLSKRAASEKYNLNFRTIQKILRHPEPPGYRRKGQREKPKIGPFVSVIHAILEADKQAHPKQRHPGKRIFDRLREEHGYTGGITVVRDEIRRWKQGSSEVFMPLAHPPGEAQFDFGEAKAIYRGRPIKVMFCVMSLPYSDAFFCQAFPRECTETFQEGHVRAFDFFGGVPSRISYDNSKIAVAKVVGRRGDGSRPRSCSALTTVRIYKTTAFPNRTSASTTNSSAARTTTMKKLETKSTVLLKHHLCTRKPLRLWFRATWQITNQKTGAIAVAVQQALGLGSYATAWTWLHKLRRVMVRPGRERLSGRVEVDETQIGTEEGIGDETPGESSVLIALTKPR